MEKLNVGKKVFITPLDRDEQYVSSVYDIDAKGIYVPIPYADKMPLILGHGERVRLKYMGEGSAYLFVTEAVGRKAEQDKLPMYIFKHPLESEITRVQLREFVRVPVMLEIQYAVPPAKNEPPVFKKAVSVDLSGGGLKMAVKENMHKGTIVLLSFSLNIKAKKKKEEFRLLGKLVRCELVDEDARVYHAGFSFLDIRPQQQDLIMAYVFERMIEIKRKQ